MLRHLRFATVFMYIVSLLFASELRAIEDVEIADNLIAQNDCDNALTILVSIYKSKKFTDEKKILQKINQCSDKVQNYQIKASSEKILLKLDPKNTELQTKYLESLFYLSKYNEALSLSAEYKKENDNVDFWILRARSMYELKQHDLAIEELASLLKKPKVSRKSEVYYWLGQLHSSSEDYDLALEDFKNAKKQKIKPKWMNKALVDLIAGLEKKNNRFHATAKLRMGYDNNILRDSIKIADATQLLDLTFDYDFIKKTKKTLGLGFDVNYQGYSRNSSYQSLSVSPRFNSNIWLTDNWGLDYLFSFGKVLTNNKSDQNYLFTLAQLNYQINSDFELQTSVGYFANLNNNPVKQVSASVLLNISFDRDYAWIGPSYKKSDAPEAVIDAISYTAPTIVDSSITTKYVQYGILGGYLKSFSDKTSVQLQYSATQTVYNQIDTSIYNQAQVEGSGARTDLNQSIKMALKYKYSDMLRYELSGAAITNISKGFQGFYSADKPSNNYDQSQILLGVTARWP